MDNIKVIASKTAMADSALQDFMKRNRLISRSTKYAIYTDLNKTLTLALNLNEKFAEVKAKENNLNQALKDKETQLKDMKSKLAEAEKKIGRLERGAETREKRLKNLESRLKDEKSKLSEAKSRIRDLERQLKEKPAEAPKFGEA